MFRFRCLIRAHFKFQFGALAPGHSVWCTAVHQSTDPFHQSTLNLKSLVYYSPPEHGCFSPREHQHTIVGVYQTTRAFWLIPPEQHSWGPADKLPKTDQRGERSAPKVMSATIAWRASSSTPGSSSSSSSSTEAPGYPGCPGCLECSGRRSHCNTLC